MKKTVFSAMVMAMALMLAISHAALADTPTRRDARTIVEQSKVGDNLRGIAFSVVRQTTSYQALAFKMGPADAMSAVWDEIGALLPQYQPQWNENIAQAYEKTFTEEELSSLATEGRSSRYVSKVVAQQSMLGKQMESTSQSILMDLASKALTAVLRKNP